MVNEHRNPQTIHEVTHSQYTVHVLDAIFNRPIFRTSDLASQLLQESGIHNKTSLGLLRQLRQAEVLRELQPGSGRRPTTLCFPRLINLAEGRQVLVSVLWSVHRLQTCLWSAKHRLRSTNIKVIARADIRPR